MSVSGSGCPACWWQGAVFIGDGLRLFPCPHCGGFSHFARSAEGVDSIDDAAPVERETREALRAWHMERNPAPRPMLRTITEGP